MSVAAGHGRAYGGAMTKTWLLFLFAVAVVAAPSTAAAAAKSCGTETALSHGAVFRVKAEHVSCKRAKRVAGSWYNVQSHGDDASRVYEADGRAWRCRITEHATGTDPG